MLFAILETEKLQKNKTSKKDSITNSDNTTTGEQHTGRQRSVSAEPDAVVSLRTTSLRENSSLASGKRGFHPALPASVLQLPRCLA